MRINFRAVVALWIMGIAAAAQTPAADGGPPAATITELKTRGVYYLHGAIASPFPGLGTRDANATIRVALDDNRTTVTVDEKARVITFTNSTRYPNKTQVGDVVFLANGKTADGVTIPLAVHVNVEKKGHTLDWEFHPHAPLRTGIKDAEIDAYDVVVSDGKTSTTVMRRAEAREVLVNPSVKLQIDARLMEVVDHLKGVKQQPEDVGFRLADVGKGVGTRMLSKMVIRAQVVSLDAANKPRIEAGDVGAMLQQGTWELRILAVSSLFPNTEFRRDLFTMGLESGPVFELIHKRGMKKGETLVFKLENGKGTAVLGKLSQPLENVVDVARAFMEFNFMGNHLAHRVLKLPVEG